MSENGTQSARTISRLASRSRRFCQIGRAHVELQSQSNLVCRLLLEKKKKTNRTVALWTPASGSVRLADGAASRRDSVGETGSDSADTGFASWYRQHCQLTSRPPDP